MNRTAEGLAKKTHISQTREYVGQPPVKEKTPLRGRDFVLADLRGLTPTPNSASRLRRLKIANSRSSVDIPSSGICKDFQEAVRLADGEAGQQKVLLDFSERTA